MNNYETTILPGTVNFHINWNCNANCVFCYRPTGSELSDSQRFEVIRLLAEHQRTSSRQSRRINFAGGEPTLVKSLTRLLEYSNSQNFSTSLITNGSVYLRNQSALLEHLPLLDMLGVSIDSIHRSTNAEIKRPHYELPEWLDLAYSVQKIGVHFKINTTVCRYNHTEDMSSFIQSMRPDRWKIFKAIEVAGTEGTTTNSKRSWYVTDDQFYSYAQRHADVTPMPIVEDDAAMRGSYAMISPDGRFYDSTRGYYNYSDLILDVGVEKAFSQVSFSHGGFAARGGLYSIPVVQA